MRSDVSPGSGHGTGLPLVGVVIAAFNAADFLAETLESIRAQSHSKWSCVVVDDGSTDQTAEISTSFAASDSRFVAVSVENGGPCLARNLGFGLLPEAVDYVTFMDADDVWEQDALVTLLEAASAPSLIGAHALGAFIDSNGQRFSEGEFETLGRSRIKAVHGRPRRCLLTEPTTFASVTAASTVFPPGLVLVKADVYRAVGLFDPDVRYAEDWDLLIRSCRAGDLAFVDRPILRYRRHGNNVGTSAEVPRACMKVRLKALTSAENSAEQRRIVRASWRASQLVDFAQRVRELRSRLRGRDFRAAPATLARLPLLVGRYLLGGPIPLVDKRIWGL